jgi:hypothetical protein
MVRYKCVYFGMASVEDPTIAGPGRIPNEKKETATDTLKIKSVGSCGDEYVKLSCFYWSKCQCILLRYTLIALQCWFW